MDLYLERFGPYVVALVASTAFYWLFPDIIGFMSRTNREPLEAVKFISALIGAFSALTFAFYAVLITYPNEFSKRIAKTVAMDRFRKYCTVAVIFGFVGSIFSTVAIVEKSIVVDSSYHKVVFSFWIFLQPQVSCNYFVLLSFSSRL